METPTKRKKKRSRDRLTKKQFEEVKYLENPRKIKPNMYYIWQYYTFEERKSSRMVTPKKLYQKHICAIPYFTRYHAKDMLLHQYGFKKTQGCHIIKGSKLLKQGFTEIEGSMKRLYSIRDVYGRWHKLKRFRYPIEWVTLPNQRHFKIALYNFYFNHTRKEFNDHYKSLYIGERYGLDKATNLSRNLAFRRTLFKLDGDNASLKEEDILNLQKKWNNYKTLFINPKDKNKWTKEL